jgi:NAD(P)-dependent dehydrogenase (short-subunit alcohol dehydrogenase family)
MTGASRRRSNQEDEIMAKVPRSLAGQVVAITGGGRGIGRATAAALIQQGARVAIGDIEAPLAEQTARELGAGTIGLGLDVTDPTSFEGFLADVETRLGPLDVLINNAGIMPIGPFVDETDATALRMVDINLNGVIFGSKLALKRFTRRGRGHLVNIASIAGKGGAPNGATYSATKHAVVGLSDSLRQELRGSGIEVSVVMPIGVNTELYSGVTQMRGLKTPEPEDVAQAIVEALQTGRFDVYVPKLMGATIRLTALLPRRTADALARLLKADRALAAPNQSARAAYEERMRRTISGTDDRAHGAPAPGTPPATTPAEAETQVV